MIFNGTANSLYTTQYQRREDCLSHETYPQKMLTGFSAGATAAEVMRSVTNNGEAELLLERDLLLSVHCPACDRRREIRRPLHDVSAHEARCDRCSGVMLTNIIHTVAQGSPEAELTLAQLGVPKWDVVRIRSGNDGHYVLLDSDRKKVLGEIA